MAADWALTRHAVALTWLADVDKSQIWAVRSGSGGPDLFVPVGLKLLIYTVDCRSDGWGRVGHTVAALLAGEEGWRRRDLGHGRRRRWGGSPDARMVPPSAAWLGEANGGGGWWRGAPVLVRYLAGVRGAAAASVEHGQLDLAQNKSQKNYHGCARMQGGRRSKRESSALLTSPENEGKRRRYG